MKGFALALAVTAGACARAAAPSAPAPATATAPAVPSRPPSPADVAFMTGMIAHHAQALVMCGMAPTHGAGRGVAGLCERVVVAQGDEIVSMQTWLADHGQPVPDPADAHGHLAHGAAPAALMPGMLTAEQLAELDAARGAAFDRLFLAYMIQHHEGALAMVNELFASNNAAQDDFVYKVASDIYADQTTEIERMLRMLAAQR